MLSQVVRELVSKALLGPLMPAQQQQVLSELAADPLLVHHISLTPHQLPALVENTPVIAYEVLLKLMHSRHINDYFQVMKGLPGVTRERGEQGLSEVAIVVQGISPNHSLPQLRIEPGPAGLAKFDSCDCTVTFCSNTGTNH